MICEHQEQSLGQHAAMLWNGWLAGLPIKYDVEVGRQVNTQLLGLLAREHPAVVEPSRLPTVLRVLCEAYKSKFSSSELDKNIATAVAHIGQEKLEPLMASGNFKDAHKKKAEQ